MLMTSVNLMLVKLNLHKCEAVSFNMFPKFYETTETDYQHHKLLALHENL